MKLLELFSGTHVLSDAFRERGWETCTVDWDESVEADYHVDIGNLTVDDVIGMCGGIPDVIWASPDCTSYSIAAVCDRDSVVAISGGARRELLEKSVSPVLSEIMDKRGIYRREKGGSELPVSAADEHFCLSVAAPILAEGDVMGAVLFVAPRGSQGAGEVEYKLAQTAAAFLGRQMEG